MLESSTGSWRVVATTSDIASAEMVAAYLRGHGVESMVPDSHTSALAWHWQMALGGVRVQVKQADESEAKELLQDYYQPTNSEERALTEQESAVLRAYRSTAVGFMLWPFVHVYVLYLAVRVLPSYRQLDASYQRKLLLSLCLSAASVAVLVALVTHFLL